MKIPAFQFYVRRSYPLCGMKTFNLGIELYEGSAERLWFFRIHLLAFHVGVIYTPRAAR